MLTLEDIVRLQKEEPITPISQLTNSLRRWKVLGRFINLGDVRSYVNKNGPGKIWNAELIDSPDPSGVIRCTFFSSAIQKFHGRFKEGAVYYVSKGHVKIADTRFNQGPYAFEIAVWDTAQIVEPTIEHR